MKALASEVEIEIGSNFLSTSVWEEINARPTELMDFKIEANIHSYTNVIAIDHLIELFWIYVIQSPSTPDEPSLYAWKRQLEIWQRKERVEANIEN